MAKIGHDDSGSYSHSLTAKVFNQLQNDILNGKYQAGDSLIETKLSSELGVSRTPIREAIRQLELEGLVQPIPNKGAIVLGVSVKDVEDIYTIRMMIEGFAARLAAESITAEELDELKEAVDLEEFYTLKNDTQHLLQFDSVFHDTLFKASKSKPLMQTLRTFHNYVRRARNNSLGSPVRAHEALQEHKAVLQAIIEHDAGEAERLTIEHIRNAKQSFLKQIQLINK